MPGVPEVMSQMARCPPLTSIRRASRYGPLYYSYENARPFEVPPAVVTVRTTLIGPEPIAGTVTLQ